MVTKVEKTVRIDYGEIKAYQMVLRSMAMVVLASTHLNLNDMVKVQRSSSCGGVEPQANGGRKIQALKYIISGEDMI